VDPYILKLSKNGGEWSASCPSHFTPRGMATGTNWMGGQVGHRASLSVVEKTKISYPCRELNSGSSASQHAAHRYTELAMVPRPTMSIL
jgi:hypothetical protein